MGKHVEKYCFYLHLNRKRSVRIEILRTSDKRLIGAFTEGEERFIDSKEGLDDQCLFELDWYVDCLKFNKKNFNALAQDTGKVRLSLAPKFFDVLVELSAETRKRGIEFSPMEKMLQTLLNEAKKAERAINLKDGEPINILSKLGIKIDK